MDLLDLNESQNSKKNLKRKNTKINQYISEIRQNQFPLTVYLRTDQVSFNMKKLSKPPLDIFLYLQLLDFTIITQ